MSSKQHRMESDGRFKSRLLFFLYVVIACLFVSGFYYHVFISKALVEVEIEVSRDSDLKIYWAKSGQPYSEEKMAVAHTNAQKQSYSFFLTDISSVERLRVDTHNYKGTVVLKKITIQQQGYKPIVLSDPDGFAALVPLEQIRKFSIDSGGMSIISTGIDPNFELFITPEKKGFDRGPMVTTFGVLCFLVFLVCWSGRFAGVEFRFVPALLFGVWLLVVAMGVVSKKNAHPDEYVHLAAVDYYVDNWVPPELSDPKIKNTFSVYGVSRLSSGEIYYFVAGKFSKLLESIALNDYLTHRIFNMLLLGVLVCYTMSSVGARMVAIPLFISPQIWYVFSYCNSDAFALFVSFLAACQIADKNSLLHRYLKGDGLSVRVGGVVCMGLLVATLLMLKKNFYPVIVLFYVCLLVKLFFTEEFYWDRKAAVIRLLAVSLLGGALFAGWIGVNYSVNGVDIQAKIATLQDSMAHKAFRPSAPLDETNSFLFKKAKGVTWQEMIQKEKWVQRCSDNCFGTFGYGNITASPIYYDLCRWTGLALSGFLLISILIRGGLQGAFTTVIVTGLGGALFIASFHHSWVYDFQPQGRYLLAIIPMMGALYCQFNRVVFRPAIILGVNLMFSLSLYFFIFHGLVEIPKILF